MIPRWKICLSLSVFAVAVSTRAALLWAGDFDTIRGVTYVQRESGELKADVYISAFADRKAHEETVKFFEENLKKPARAVN
ncbi:MAG: hypothetical protein HY288_18460 [Planctomycetia bacterium]|nr:hypothetical protein [Planctomycetia bacterium]